MRKPYTPVPITQVDHPFCYDMRCSVCTHRCYENWPGHFYPKDEDRCSCGQTLASQEVAS